MDDYCPFILVWVVWVPPRMPPGARHVRAHSLSEPSPRRHTRFSYRHMHASYISRPKQASD